MGKPTTPCPATHTRLSSNSAMSKPEATPTRRRMCPTRSPRGLGSEAAHRSRDTRPARRIGRVPRNGTTRRCRTLVPPAHARGRGPRRSKGHRAWARCGTGGTLVVQARRKRDEGLWIQPPAFRHSHCISQARLQCLPQSMRNGVSGYVVLHSMQLCEETSLQVLDPARRPHRQAFDRALQRGPGRLARDDEPTRDFGRRRRTPAPRRSGSRL